MSLTYSAHISWLFTEFPYGERVQAARAAGFHRIETAWPDDQADRDRLPRVAAEAGVQVVLLNCPAGEVHEGERGYLNDPSRREEAERGFLAAAELAGRLGTRNLNLLVGRELPGIPPAAQRRAVVEVLRALGPRAAARGLRLLLEPINAIENPGYLAPTPGDALALIEECGSAEGLGLLFDVYHVARAGGDPVEAIGRCRELIAHVQISDCPGRGRPGSGELDIAHILERLVAVGYEGSIGLEYEPRGSTERSLEFLYDENYPMLL